MSHANEHNKRAPVTVPLQRIGLVVVLLLAACLFRDDVSAAATDVMTAILVGNTDSPLSVHMDVTSNTLYVGVLWGLVRTGGAAETRCNDASVELPLQMAKNGISQRSCVYPCCMSAIRFPHYSTLTLQIASRNMMSVATMSATHSRYRRSSPNFWAVRAVQRC